MPWWMKYYLQEEENGAEAPQGSSGSADSAEGSGSDDAGSSVNWTEFNDDFDSEEDVGEGETVEGDVVIEPGSHTPPPVAKPVTPQAAPVQAAPPAPPAPAAAPVPPVAPAQAQTPPPQQPQAPAAQPSGPAPEEYGTWRTNRLTELEQHYAVNGEDATALLTEPELVLPKLAARVHMEVLESAMRAMQAMVPVMMEQTTAHTAINTQAKGLFHSVNPDLADPKLEPAIIRLGMTYREVNPTAGPEESARAIGNLVRAALGIVTPQAGVQPQAAPRPAPVAPFVPMRGGGGGQRAPVSDNQFTALAQEMLMDDDVG